MTRLKKAKQSERRRRDGAAAPARDRAAPPVVGFVSLGCVKNLVDSERMLAQIAESGAIISLDESVADTIVVNTCGFLGAARDEAMAVIAELAERKRRGKLKRIVVAGCLVQRDGEQIRERIPEVDVLVGVHNRADVARAVWQRPRDGAVDRYLGDYHPQPWSDQGRLRLTPRHYAYVRISEGCNQKCTFCTIPAIRGPLHSKSPDALVAECRELIADGARELVLIGQDTTSYGADIGYAPGLAGLLRRLDGECTGVRWLRLMYVYPTVLTDEILAAIAECQRVVKYIDIPLQHISTRMLKLMGRRIARAQTEALLERIRTRIPDVAIRTTMIVGFPGETETEFEELLAFMRDFGFDAAGAFKYSHEPETPAARLPGPLDEAKKAERYERFMLTQQELALRAARRRVGRTLEVLVDERQADGAAGRHAGQAPEVDALCLLPGAPRKPGEFIRAEVIDTQGYDLVVRPTRPRRPR
jgi:ribosomal protein S12 methylthiotransferase